MQADLRRVHCGGKLEHSFFFLSDRPPCSPYRCLLFCSWSLPCPCRASCSIPGSDSRPSSALHPDPLCILLFFVALCRSSLRLPVPSIWTTFVRSSKRADNRRAHGQAKTRKHEAALLFSSPFRSPCVPGRGASFFSCVAYPRCVGGACTPALAVASASPYTPNVAEQQSLLESGWRSRGTRAESLAAFRGDSCGSKLRKRPSLAPFASYRQETRASPPSLPRRSSALAVPLDPPARAPAPSSSRPSRGRACGLQAWRLRWRSWSCSRAGRGSWPECGRFPCSVRHK